MMIPLETSRWDGHQPSEFRSRLSTISTKKALDGIPANNPVSMEVSGKYVVKRFIGLNLNDILQLFVQA